MKSVTERSPSPAEGASSWLALLLYNAALTGALPALAALAAYRKLVLKKGEGWPERFGAAPRRADGAPRVWVHAVSAGEVTAALPVVRELEALAPGLDVIVSTLTPAGKAMAERSLGRPAFFFPLDLYPAVARALACARPDVVVLTEAEFWPNFLHAAAARHVPTLLVSGRVSDRGFRRARWIRSVLRWALPAIQYFGMQSALDAERIQAMGAPRDRIEVVGNTKFDLEPEPLSPAERERLRADLRLPAAPAWVAGSTRPGEEEAVMDAHRQLLAAHPGARLVLAPRHLERLEEVEAIVQGRGFRPIRRSRLDREDPAGREPEVLILDTMGELGRVYSVGFAGFVGGTLAPFGGHNPLQPVAQGVPVLFGPHTHNCRDLADRILAAGAGTRVSDAGALGDALLALLDRPELAAQQRDAGAGLMRANRGAARRYAQRVLAAIEK